MARELGVNYQARKWVFSVSGVGKLSWEFKVTAFRKHSLIKEHCSLRKKKKESDFCLLLAGLPGSVALRVSAKS